MGAVLRFLAGAMVVAIAACSGNEDPAPGSIDPGLSQQSLFSQLPGWHNDSFSGWLSAWQGSCHAKAWQRAPEATGRQRWRELCLQTPPQDPTGLRQWIEQNFVVRIPGEQGLVTGYFVPAYPGSRTKTARFSAPIYKPPHNLKILASTGAGFDRAAIENGALADKRLELVWLDPIDAFFLHIQGSGTVELAGGSRVQLGFAGHNGHQYHAIGRDLVQWGALRRDEVSMQSIRRWLRENPSQAAALMQRNPRYIFFEERPDEGAIGASGVTLTPERSIAVDPQHIVYGLPVWIDAAPDPRHSGGRLQRLTVAQDTGAAIKGAGRIDFFWGHGEQAGAIAGRMKSAGTVYMLSPRPAGPDEKE